MLQLFQCVILSSNFDFLTNRKTIEEEEDSNKESSKFYKDREQNKNNLKNNKHVPFIINIIGRRGLIIQGVVKNNAKNDIKNNAKNNIKNNNIQKLHQAHTQIDKIKAFLLEKRVIGSKL